MAVLGFARYRTAFDDVLAAYEGETQGPWLCTESEFHCIVISLYSSLHGNVSCSKCKEYKRRAVEACLLNHLL